MIIVTNIIVNYKNGIPNNNYFTIYQTFFS